MRFEPPLLAGVLLRRYKRFLADITLPDGSQITAHCPNPGAMTGCAEPGWPVALSYHTDPRRKLAYTLEMVNNGQSWIGVNTQRANQLVAEALENRQLPELAAYAHWQREVRYGDRSRVDFLLSDATGAHPLCYLEVKSVTLLRAGRNQFPDAVTQRGTRHIQELVAMKQAGHRAILLFVVQREDGTGFEVAADIDPAYAQALRMSQEQGLEVLIYQARLSPEQWVLDKKII